MKPRHIDNIVDACLDEKLFQRWFQDVETWAAWMAFMKAVFGLKKTKADKAIIKAATNRTKIKKTPYREAWLVVGRRGGKSRMLALMAVFLACFHNWKPFLSPGERGTIMIVAADRKQARVIFRYIEAFLKEVPLLDGLIQRHTMESFELNNGINIEIHTASFRTVRGYTIIAALLDEIAFFRADDSSNPDYEIIEAIRPGMGTIPNAMLLCASSPYARRGELWNNYKDHFGVDDSDILIWQAETRFMNPSLDPKIIERAYKRDPATALAEYGAQFRTDVERLVTEEVITANTIPKRFELPPSKDQYYLGFVDPSGGSADSFSLGIAHLEGDERHVLDLVREVRPPFSPESTVTEFAHLLKRYGISEVVGDRYAGEWPRERFRNEGIHYKVSVKTKSEIYREMLPLLNSEQCELLDHEIMRIQLLSLERRTSRGGKDSIDHPPGGHDDVINSAAGALVECHIGGVELW